MFAAHRDQENLLHSHQVPTKQQPKTPGTRYPKTPLKAGRNDENAPTGVLGKSVVGGTKVGGNEKLATKATGHRQALVTPMEARNRAPLGNKTTNAKARIGQTAGVKDIVREIERTQLKPTATTTRSGKHKSGKTPPAEAAVQATAQTTGSECQEPEYAPPIPAPLPYQSDVLPEGGLTVEGLRKENLLRGYYNTFHNPIGDNGVSRKEQGFSDEMAALLEKTTRRNEFDIDALSWNSTDVAETVRCSKYKTDARKGSAGRSANLLQLPTQVKRASALSSTRAASALSMASGNKMQHRNRLARTQTSRRAHLGSLTYTKPAIHVKKTMDDPLRSGSPGEAASRTTIGYSKGRTASSLIRSHRGGLQSAFTELMLSGKAPPTEMYSDLTTTQAQIRKPTHDKNSVSQPQFLSIFDDIEDEGDLPQMYAGEDALNHGEEEEFELTMDA